MMFKRIMWASASVALLIFLLSGCVKFEMDVKVNPNKSADVNVTFLINSMVAGMAQSSGGEGINLNEMKTSAEKAGYKATNQKEGDMIGYLFTKHFNNVSELSKESSANTNLQDFFKAGKPDSQIFSIKKGLLQDTYTVDLDMNLDTIKPPADDGNEFTSSIAKTMMVQMDFKFKTTLPIKTVSNNASKVSEDGKSLEWQLLTGQDNKIKMEFHVWNMTNIVLILAGLIIILAIILFFIFRRKKKSMEITDLLEAQNLETDNAEETQQLDSDTIEDSNVSEANQAEESVEE